MSERDDGALEPTRKPSKEEAKQEFLDGIRNLCTDTRAAALAGYALTTFRIWQEDDLEFATAVAQAKEERVDVAEENLIKRAIFGFEEPVFYQGEIVGYKRVYSDRLAEFLMKAWKPEKYSEKHHAEPAAITRPSARRLKEARKSGSTVDFSEIAKAARDDAAKDEEALRKRVE